MINSPKVSLTDLEMLALKAITFSDFYENARESICWDFSVYECCELKGKTRSGVYSSLTQKGIIYVTEKEKKFYKDSNGTKQRNPHFPLRGEPNFGTIQITEFGYEVLDSLDLIDQYGSFK